MIAELVLYGTARTAPPLRRLGLVGDAVALWSRATRRREAWSPHEARCHAAVDRAVAALVRRDTVVVLGSGLARDVPLDRLMTAFGRVVLVDAVHLLPVRLRTRGRADLVIRDLTGFARCIGGLATEREAPLADLADDRRVDLVISANLLSQLPRAVERRLERDPSFAARLPADLPRRIVAGHLADLAALAAPACLLTDVAYREVGRDGAESEPFDLLHGITLPEPDEAWTWEVAPRGELDRTVAFVHSAGAWQDVGAALRARAEAGR